MLEKGSTCKFHVIPCMDDHDDDDEDDELHVPCFSNESYPLIKYISPKTILDIYITVEFWNRNSNEYIYKKKREELAMYL